MKSHTIVALILLVLTVILVGMVVNVAFAAPSQQLPEGVEAFYYIDKLGNEWLCFNQVGGIDCERLDPCPCIGGEAKEPLPTPTYVPGDPTPTPIPGEPTPTPEPEKPKCNCGKGNQSEGCDPNPICGTKKNTDE